jgi:hypothetical protein
VRHAELEGDQHGARQRGQADHVAPPWHDGDGHGEQHSSGLDGLLGDTPAAAPLAPDRERRLA